MNAVDKKSQTKEVLIEAAKRLFIEKGYEGVSTRELADEAGVNLGAIQYHFGSKARLFVETVYRLMEGSDCHKVNQIVATEAQTREEAGARLCEFVLSFLYGLLKPTGPQPCRMMFREIFSNTSNDPEMFEALISTIVQDFIEPVDSAIIHTLKIISPDLNNEALQNHTQSIIGQCFFYFSHSPFLKRLRNKDLEEPASLQKIAAHISTVSLSALHCDQRFIDRAIAAGFEAFTSHQISGNKI